MSSTSCGAHKAAPAPAPAPDAVTGKEPADAAAAAKKEATKRGDVEFEVGLMLNKRFQEWGMTKFLEGFFVH